MGTKKQFNLRVLKRFVAQAMLIFACAFALTGSTLTMTVPTVYAGGPNSSSSSTSSSTTSTTSGGSSSAKELMVKAFKIIGWIAVAVGIITCIVGGISFAGAHGEGNGPETKKSIGMLGGGAAAAGIGALLQGSLGTSLATTIGELNL